MRLTPLHGGGDPNDPWIQRFIDSDGGVFLASLTHTTGALLFTAGIALYLYVAHLLRKHDAAQVAPNMGLLNYAHGFTLVGIAMNGLGGLSRLKQSDHPTLTDLTTSTWVQVILIKHLFLMAGIAFAVYLTWRTRGFGRTAKVDMPKIQGESKRMVTFALGSFLTILLATTLGVIAQNSPLPEDMEAGGDDIDDMDMSQPAFGVLAGPDTYSGTLSGPSQAGALGGVPALGGTAAGETFDEHRFTVPQGADHVEIKLEWTRQADQEQLQLAVTDGNGTAVTNSTVEGATITIIAAGAEVVPGGWTIRVDAVTATRTPYTVTASASRTGGANSLVDEVTIAAGEILEINLAIQLGASFSYEWSLMGTQDAIKFDIHTHTENGEFKAVDGEFNSHEGSYTHNGELPAAAVFWENTSPQAVTLHYSILGSFEVSSICDPGCPE